MRFDCGDKVGNYLLLQKCGKGGYGEVFLARNILNNQTVALKLLKADAAIQERELRGLLRYRDCRHHNLLPVYHVDKIGSQLYYTMAPADNLAQEGEPYLPDTLANRLEKQLHSSADELLKTAKEILAALDVLHSSGLVHRDIKPDNVLFINQRAVLGDVGLTAVSGGDTLVGTLDFMSPALLRHEHAAGKEDDYYALSRVLYVALTGFPVNRFPFITRKMLESKSAMTLWRYIRMLDRGITPGDGLFVALYPLKHYLYPGLIALALAVGILPLASDCLDRIGTEPELSHLENVPEAGLPELVMLENDLESQYPELYEISAQHYEDFEAYCWGYQNKVTFQTIFGEITEEESVRLLADLQPFREQRYRSDVYIQLTMAQRNAKNFFKLLKSMQGQPSSSVMLKNYYASWQQALAEQKRCQAACLETRPEALPELDFDLCLAYRKYIDRLTQEYDRLNPEFIRKYRSNKFVSSIAGSVPARSLQELIKGVIEPELEHHSETQILWSVIRKMELTFANLPVRDVSRRRPADFEKMAVSLFNVLEQYRYAANRLRELGEIR